MRFSRLSLERYGRFEDCALNFRLGSPDLHIIYGANEAGKTTSLAAVSDLLFGFPVRSPYNFLFDYSLLRVGAVLEDSGATLACRRKKGSAGTLLDANEAVIDDAPLRAMLKGQTRETFGLSFSLNQDALRSGGRAMVEAKNDVGRALFAAGSGLTGVADELKKLEAESDGIWGPTAKASRTFTQALRIYSESSKTVRDNALKPKAWSDAKATSECTREALAAARRERDQVHAELSGAERVRRLAPVMRQRDEQLASLDTFADVVDLGRQREDAAEALINEAEEAVRQATAAELLQRDIAERRAKIAADTAVLDESEEIDRLVADSGAEAKAARDLVGLEQERIAATANVERLRAEAGVNADATPQRSVAAKLRDLARRHGEHQVASQQLTESRQAIEARRERAQSSLDASPAEATPDALVDAVDAARSLGADADERVEAALRQAEVAGIAVAAALGRLVPWNGDFESLIKLPTVGDREIEVARDELAALAATIRREEDDARRSNELAAGLALEIAQTATGTAVSPEEILEALQLRESRWRPIRDHVLNGAPLAGPAAAVEGFEACVASVDEKMERRFNLAEASSRLTVREQTKAGHELEASQAGKRAEDAKERHEQSLKVWLTRLVDAGLPELDPSRFQTWQADRMRAEAAHSEHQDLLADAKRSGARRDAVRQALSAALALEDSGGLLAPVLLAAERRRSLIEEVEQKRRVAQSELDQVAIDAEALEQRQGKLDPDIAKNAFDWTAALAEARLNLDVVTCGAVLDVLDELREATAGEALLRRRIDGINRDARDHASSVDAIADRIGVPPGDAASRLRMLRERLAAARSSATLLGSLDEEGRRRGGEVDEAQAKLKAAEEALGPLLAETKSADRPALGAAIERSRVLRALRDEIAATERRIVADGDGLALAELIAAVSDSNPDQIAERVASLNAKLEELNESTDEAATAHGDARSTFAALATEGTSAVDAATDAEQAKSELEVLAEHYILKRSQAVMLKWAIEKYRERHQDPLLLRAGELFSILTTGRYATLKIDADGATPRLLGMRDDQRTMVEVDAMSEGTTDQLFLALRLAALEQSVAAGISLPFLADDLFVNFDDERAEAGFKVLAEVSKSTQVLFFTHHPHLVQIAKSVVGAELHSECSLS
ncbi:ATP-binding protein [Sphingomonas cavernae]|uniref:Chromosome segregation protein SMC n=1 Tax=Sphingomonas cavernae TaxID=2320861 RepID=A0A418WJV8_9SPHN|nr:YhaN family protein [Sphingomonas cavernae]RJF90317.1 chromosome segregation protein SMC [Sphingomonas cavernae]